MIIGFSCKSNSLQLLGSLRVCVGDPLGTSRVELPGLQPFPSSCSTSTGVYLAPLGVRCAQRFEKDPCRPDGSSMQTFEMAFSNLKRHRPTWFILENVAGVKSPFYF